MSSSTYSDVEKYQLAPLRETIHKLETQRTVLEENIRRLCDDAFDQGDLAFLKLQDMLTNKGATKVCDTLDNKRWNSRASLGFRRGSLLSPDRARRANEAIAALKVQVGVYEKLANDLKDQRAAYRSLAEEAGSPTSSPVPLLDYPVWGARPSQNEEETWYHKPVNPQPSASELSWFRKKPKQGEDEGTSAAGERETPNARPR